MNNDTYKQIEREQLLMLIGDTVQNLTRSSEVEVYKEFSDVYSSENRANRGLLSRNVYDSSRDCAMTRFLTEE